MFKHTDKTDARIRRGYEAGDLVVDIAAELRVTRDVVIGRARRLGLAKTGRQYRSPGWGRGLEGAALENFILACTLGHAKYHANRKANHSTALRSEPEE